MTGDEFERLVRRRIEEFGGSIVDVLRRLPNDRPDAWRPRVAEVVERWRRAGAQLTADSEASLFRLIDERAALRRSQSAFAEGGAANDAAPTMNSGSPSSSGAPQAPKLEEINPADIATGKVHYVRFKHSLRSGEMFYFTVDGNQWFKCPYRLAVWQGKQYVDVRQAVPYNPTGFQRYLLSHEGALSDPGWRAILERYAERFGYDAEQQVLRDLATLSADENVKAQASTFMWALLIGMAVGGTGKVLRKILDKYRGNLAPNVAAKIKKAQAEADAIRNEAKKAGPEALQQRAEKLKQELRDLAAGEGKAAKKELAEAVDNLDEDLRKAAKGQPAQPTQSGAVSTPQEPIPAKGPPKPSPNFVKPAHPPQPPPAQSSLPDGHTVRIGGPTEQYPNGYWIEYNALGQPVDPTTHRPPPNLSRSEARARVHVPLPESK